MKGQKCERGVRGFTLIELLVVIGIVGVLMSLLLPAIAGARDISRQTVCASRIRDVGNAAQGYLLDYDGWLNGADTNPLILIEFWQHNPDTSTWPVDPTSRGPYSTSFLCPNDANPNHHLFDNVGGTRGGYKSISYGINLGIWGASSSPYGRGNGRNPVKPNSVRAPSDTVFFVDASTSRFGNANTTNSWGSTYDAQPAQYTSGTFQTNELSWNGILLRHNGGRGYNTVMVDGHVENFGYADYSRSFIGSNVTQ